ncbi:MAG: hypothetical protein R3D82_10310 [Xanthobacteraceae bacterium]
MRKTEANGWMARAQLSRGGWLMVVLAIGLVVTAGPVRAADDEEEDNDKTFEEKIIENIMTGLGGTNMENRGIHYRERSPLVVPPKLDLPPPGGGNVEAKVPNWPKDPDEQRHKALVEARKKARKDPGESSRMLMPSELNVKRASKSTDGKPVDQAGYNNVLLSPSQLGYNGSILGLFKGNQSESAEFKGEPTRDSLTQPPVGYQTPSPNYAYGTGPKESLNKECSAFLGNCKD